MFQWPSFSLCKHSLSVGHSGQVSHSQDSRIPHSCRDREDACQGAEVPPPANLCCISFQGMADDGTGVCVCGTDHGVHVSQCVCVRVSVCMLFSCLQWRQCTFAWRTLRSMFGPQGCGPRHRSQISWRNCDCPGGGKDTMCSNHRCARAIVAHQAPAKCALQLQPQPPAQSQLQLSLSVRNLKQRVAIVGLRRRRGFVS